MNNEALSTAQVAAIFNVTTRTIGDWTRKGLLPATRTLGGHYRYNANTIRSLITSSLSLSDPTKPLRPELATFLDQTKPACNHEHIEQIGTDPDGNMITECLKCGTTEV